MPKAARIHCGHPAKSMASLVMLERHLWCRRRVSPKGLFGPLWTGLQKGFRRLRRHLRRCVTSSPSALAPWLWAARRIPPLSLQSRRSLSGNLSLGCSSAPGWRNASPFRGVKVPAHELCWTQSCLSRPDVLERKRRGSVLASAGMPRKTARIHPPSLRAPLSNGVSFPAGYVLQVQRIPECFTAVIADPHTIKSKFPLHTLSLTHSNASSPPSLGELSFAKINPLASHFTAWAAIPGVSSWVLKTTQRGYSLQFARRPPRFRGIIQTSVSDNEAFILRQEVQPLLAKGA